MGVGGLAERGTLRMHGDQLVRPDMLDFAVNVWPGSRAPRLEDALRRALAESAGYPDERAARAAIAARHERGVEEVLLLNGACEAFWLLAQAIRPRRAVCVHPSFTEPEAALRAVGSDVVHLQREPERWTFAAADVDEQADMVVVGHPNNPTGTLAEREQIAALARERRLLVLDESFIDLTCGEPASFAEARELPGLVVVRSLTKAWSLAGVRAGYLLGAPDLVAALAAQRQPWSVNAIACAALTACAQDRDTPRRVAAEVALARAQLVEQLQAIAAVRVWPSRANFLLLRVPDGPDLVDALARRGIAVRPAASFPGLDDSHIRVAVRQPADNAVLVGALAELLER